MLSVSPVGVPQIQRSYERPLKEPEPKELLLKPIMLENSWSFWFDRYAGPGLTVEEYAASLCRLGTFNSIQSFWNWFNNLPPTSKLGARMSYHLMKGTIRPLWEDLENIDGGTFSIKVSKQETDSAWLQLLLAVVGEQFFRVLKENDDICGVSVSIRRDDNIINLWHKNARSIDVVKCSSFISSIFRQIKIQGPITYKVHQNEENFKADFNKGKQQSQPVP